MTRSVPRKRNRIVGASLLVAVVATMLASAPTRADEPVPDRTGAFQSVPNATSVPGYTKLDPEKATTKDLAVAVDAVDVDAGA